MPPNLSMSEQFHFPRTITLLEGDENSPFDFDFQLSCGTKAFFRMFPHPWNKEPSSLNRKPASNVSSMISSGILPKLDQKCLDYFNWRSSFTQQIHRDTCDVQTKVVALRACLSDEIKASLSTTIELSARGYYEAVLALEAEFGGNKRLLHAALNDLKKVQPLKNDRPEDLKVFSQRISCCLQRLRESGLGNQAQNEMLFLEVMRPLTHHQRT